MDEYLERVRASRALHEPWVYPVAEPAAFEKWIVDGQAENVARFALCGNGDGAIIGVFNLSEIVRGSFQCAYLGYWVLSPFERKGYMREGLELLLQHAFGEMGLHRIEANIQPGNEASLALVRAAGFRREGFSPRYLKIGGEWRDHERWAITVEDRTA
jgi:ribosomal-protein-alanine N-acetyltransferase